MRTIILASHGGFGKGMLESAKMILGEGAGNIRAYAMYPGDSAEDYAKELEKEILENPDTEYVIMADLFGASVCTAMTGLTKYKNAVLFSGMSFTMLLELLTSFPEALTEEDILRLINSAREGIKNIDVKEANDETEDF
ncbi:MAG: PTS mannose transporter subunit IIC [Lachnospiraceae bacterium]|nr:PTS mannose transporter subunit IIC [Lachnospiraceae bacterium]